MTCVPQSESSTLTVEASSHHAANKHKDNLAGETWRLERPKTHHVISRMTNDISFFI